MRDASGDASVALAASALPCFGTVREISTADFLSEVDEEDPRVIIAVHLYEPGLQVRTHTAPSPPLSPLSLPLPLYPLSLPLPLPLSPLFLPLPLPLPLSLAKTQPHTLFFNPACPPLLHHHPPSGVRAHE
jgi:hypothetical protein